MATQKQIEANRRNAQKSSGPRSVAGKKRSSQNAYRHGLTKPLCGVDFEQRLEIVARQTSEDNKSTLELARAAATGDLELARVRHFKEAIIEHVMAHGDLDGFNFGSEFQRRDRQRTATPVASSHEHPLEEEHDWSQEEVQILLVEFEKLLRYEERAVARRNSAIRKISASHMGNG